jgi:Lhr-like helicase
LARLDAIHLSDSLQQRLLDFALSDNFLRDASLQEACRTLWLSGPTEGGLAGEIWVEAALPPLTSGKTLPALMQSGALNEQLVKQLVEVRGIFPADRPLYTHQAEAVERAARKDKARPAIIVSAGTGAGKTESFLLPVLSQLYSEKRKSQTGCRAIILYPMNALVNDQVDRLYDWLQGQTRLSICHFTSETAENAKIADKNGVPRFHPCRHRTRQQARGLESARGDKIRPQERKEPPDVLITNYSMLEYMLCRPQDRVLFGPGLRAVVLDEAHLYNGTLAAEMTLLLRRLYDKCGVCADDVANYATSATIGTGDPEELRDFAGTIFSKKKENVEVIQGKKAGSEVCDAAPPEKEPTPETLLSIAFDTPTIVMSAKGQEHLLENAEACAALEPLLRCLVGSEVVRRYALECANRPAALLLALAHSPYLHTIDELLRERKSQVSLRELAQLLWARTDPSAQRATAKILSLAASARARLSDTPLLPHRLHLMLKAPHGISACCNEACSGPPALVVPPLGALSEGRHELCPHCRHAALALYRCGTCGHAALAASRKAQSLNFRPPLPFEKEARILTLVPGTGKAFYLDSEQAQSSIRGLRLWDTGECPNCQEPAADYEPLASRDPLALSIMAETLFAELPPMACEQEDDNTILPSQGRRLLAFSDSRSEASRLGPRLSRQHDRQILRSAIVRMFEKAPAGGDAVIAYLKKQIEEKERSLQSGEIPPEIEAQVRQQRDDLQATLLSVDTGGSLIYWSGILAKDSQLMQALLDEESESRHFAESWIAENHWESNYHQNVQRSQEFLELELARLPKRPFVSVETIGCVEAVYPNVTSLPAPDGYIGTLGTPSLRSRLEQVWPDLVSALLDTLRQDHKVTLGSHDRDMAWDGFAPMGQWVSQTDFCGSKAEHRRRRFAKNVLAQAGFDGDPNPMDIDALLQAVFRQLCAKAVQVKGFDAREATTPEQFRWLEVTQRVREGRGLEDHLRIYFPDISLRKPQQLYQCSRTGHVWPRSVMGCAVDAGCKGTLEPKSAQELDESPWVGRQRREYRSSDIPALQIGLWAAEHSAQLDPREGRRLQELFRAGMRNVLSSTTTLELGIDIGGLSGVFLSNVPPGKANYLQRAGRVGRRADGSSVVLTCARSRPYDREVFRRMGDFLSAPLRQPVVFLQRDRIVRRHFHAWLMGQFFGQLYEPKHHLGAMTAFGQMGRFCGQPFPDKWTKDKVRRPAVQEPGPCLPDDFCAPVWWPDREAIGLVDPFCTWIAVAKDHQESVRLRRLFQGTELAELDDWSPLFDAALKSFRECIASWTSSYCSLLEIWRHSNEAAQANSVRYQMQVMQEMTVIGYLSDARFLPRYGFPIGVHKLRVSKIDEKGRQRAEDQYRLERSSLLALREYVPGSQLLVGGKIITSRGLLRHWSGANLDKAFGASGGLQKCPNGHEFYWVAVANPCCPYCEETAEGKWESLLFPEHGFTTAVWDPPRRSSDTERVGEVDTATVAFTNRANVQRKPLEIANFAQVPELMASYEEEGELLVYNKGNEGKGFIICTACGYSESEKGSEDKAPPRGFQNHRPLFADLKAKPCAETFGKGAMPLRGKVLAAREPTDIVKLDFGPYLKSSAAPLPVVTTTLAVAFHIAGARLLQLDSRELGHMVMPTGEAGSSLGAGIYDNVPGGAGHVLELLSAGSEWLRMTRDLLYGTEKHHKLCRNACLDCLMTFDAQMHLAQDDGALDRRAALAVLERMLGSRTHGAGKGSLPLYPIGSLGGGAAEPVGTVEVDASANEYLAVKVTGQGMSRKFAPGEILLFRKLIAADPLPDKNALVLVQDACIEDPDYGSVTFAAFGYTRASNGGDNATVRVVLRRDSHDRETYKEPIKLDIPEAAWPQWRPIAVFERRLGSD